MPQLLRRVKRQESARDDDRKHEVPLYSLPPISRSSSMHELGDTLGIRPPQYTGKAPIERPFRPLFHKPTSSIITVQADWRPDKKKSPVPSIASLYTQNYQVSKPVAPNTPVRIPSQPNLRRAARQSNSLNIMVVGQKATGKTAFLKLLVSQTQLSQSANEDLKERIKSFGCDEKGRLQQTRIVNSLSTDIVEGGERLQLTIYDTPGFDTRKDEYKANLAMNNILNVVETKFQDTLQQEPQVIRASAKTTADHHIHLVLYFLQPQLFIEQSEKTSNTKVSPSELTSTNNLEKIDEEGVLSMCPADLRYIKKLSRRANVIPIIARADELTIARLASLRAAVLLGMQSEGLSFGLLLYSSLSETQDLDLVPPLPSLESSVVEGMVNSVSAPEISRSASESNIPTVYEDRPRLVRVRSRSKSFSKARRRTLDNNDRLQLFSTLDIEESSLPFAIMGPDVLPHQSFEGISLKRIYRWGSINILDDMCSDFNQLRSTCLSTHTNVFREATRALYEEFRTEKLLAKRSTHAIPEKILQELNNI